MKKLFFAAILLLTLFEIANVYFIMPMPGSQQMDSINLAYFLYSWRWAFRIGLGLIATIALWKARFALRHWWIPALALLIWGSVAYVFNFKMTAERMFTQADLVMKTAEDNQVELGRLVLGVSHHGEASAYPIQYLAYHHQVRDQVGDQPVMVTYCNVCRTGRAFAPKVNGMNENFRLVGMDHFNAMFEDSHTKSWWRQENGEAIAGPLKGLFLPEIPSSQMTLRQWLRYYPNSKIMQPDTTYQKEYTAQKNYEIGNKKGFLTRTDTVSWRDKSWVIGIQIGQASKAFDWNELKKKRLIQDQINSTPILVALAKDNKSFVAFERPGAEKFSLRNDTLFAKGVAYNWLGQPIQAEVTALKRIKAHQDFWHSWRTFHGDAR